MLLLFYAGENHIARTILSKNGNRNALKKYKFRSCRNVILDIKFVCLNFKRNRKSSRFSIQNTKIDDTYDQ